MASNETKIFLCTANVGTVFECLGTMSKTYIDELVNKVEKVKPEFVAIHMQEIGGKNYKQAMQLINGFFKDLLQYDIIKEYDRYLIAIDSDFTDDLTFTSLCSIYLIHSSLREQEVEIYNFKEKCFYKYITKQIYTGNLSENDFIYKERFEKKFFPDFNWSRKGFIQSKWRIRNKIINLVNVHLFHDASNLLSINKSPSIYSDNRQKALKYTIEKIKHNKSNFEKEKHHFALFGDLNFRLDLGSLIENYTQKPHSSGIKQEDSQTKIFQDTNNKDIFIIADKKFKWNNIDNELNNLLQFDKELKTNEEPLYELNKNFPPSYPFMEDMVNAERYMETRCPAWCDRVIFNADFKKDIAEMDLNIEYGMIGQKVCMGDHKPVYLLCKIKSEAQSFIDETNIPNSIKLDSNNNASSSGNNHKKSYVYINNNLSDLNNSVVDLHDNAWFTNSHILKFLIDLNKYPNYSIMNIASTKQTNQYEDFEQRDINLNQWLKAIGEIIIQIHKSNQLNVDVCYKTNKNFKSESDCKCVSQIINLSSSYLVNFFLDSLNANFFKFKHLISFLNEQITFLKHETNASDPTQEIINTSVKFTTQDLDAPLNISPKSLDILSEILCFLSSTCMLNLLRSELKKSLIEKKLLTYFNFSMNKNSNSID